jgi:hypothetical protein
MLPPHNRALTARAGEQVISEGRLCNWRRDGRAREPVGWSAADNFAAVIKAAALNAPELREYRHKRGLCPDQLRAWRRACEQANDWPAERRRQSHRAGRVAPASPRAATRSAAQGAGGDRRAACAAKKNRNYLDGRARRTSTRDCRATSSDEPHGPSPPGAQDVRLCHRQSMWCAATRLALTSSA